MDNMIAEQIAAAEARLRPCPFCGCRVEIGICDEEGNYKWLEYLDDTYSGIYFVITHYKGKGCILHTRAEELEQVGTSLFYSLDELVDAWDTRVQEKEAR